MNEAPRKQLPKWVEPVIILLLALLWRLFRWFWKKVFPKKTPPTPKA